jgi:hypothetical protein
MEQFPFPKPDLRKHCCSMPPLICAAFRSRLTQLGWPLLASIAFGADPLFKNSVVSNDIDFIQANDATTAFEVTALGRAEREMPGREGKELVAKDVYLFSLRFADGVCLEVWADPDFPTTEAAQEWVQHIGKAVAKQPAVMRKRLKHVVLNRGDHTAFAEEQQHFFVLYEENLKKRLATHDLEETVFHESVHAAFEEEYASENSWLEAQQQDGNFITEYQAGCRQM